MNWFFIFLTSWLIVFGISVVVIGAAAFVTWLRRRYYPPRHLEESDDVASARLAAAVRLGTHLSEMRDVPRGVARVGPARHPRPTHVHPFIRRTR